MMGEQFIDQNNKKELREQTKLGEGDREIFRSIQTGDGLIPITSKEQLMDLAEALSETHKSFLDMVEVLTHDQAVFVRMLRVDKSYTWRAVAEACHEQSWDNFNLEDWQPPSNQLMGMALCEQAAKFFDEDYMEKPWN